MKPEAPPAERVEAWSSIPGLVHGFFGRRGGVSPEPWQSLNLSYKVGDRPERVDSNWSAVQQALGRLHLRRMDQVHGSELIVVDGSERGEVVGAADGLATESPGLGLVVMTADCVPILMVAPTRRIAIALHAGWRGTVAGIAKRGVETGERCFGVPAAEWQIAIGPAIEACCYEVDAEIGDRLQAEWGSMPDAWRRRGAKGDLDLRSANRSILEGAGVPVSSIHLVGSCTACSRQRYFSHRGSGGKTGRQAAIVGFAE